MSAYTDYRTALQSLPKDGPYPEDNKGGIWSIPIHSRDGAGLKRLSKGREPFIIDVDDVHVWFYTGGGIRRVNKKEGGEIDTVAYFNAHWVTLDGTNAYIIVPFTMFRLSQYGPLSGEEEDLSLKIRGEFTTAFALPDRVFALESVAVDRRGRFVRAYPKDGSHTLLLEHSVLEDETEKPLRFQTFKGWGRQLAIVDDDDLAVVLIRGDPIRVVSLRSQDGPCREIPESRGTDRFAICGKRIYFPSSEAPEGTIRVMSTPITGFTIDQAADDFAYAGTRSEFSWVFKVYGDAIYFGDAEGGVLSQPCREW